MIDIHNHSLFGVDDGASTLKESVAMIKDAYRQGIDTIIVTPHYRHGMFFYPLDVIESNFAQLMQAVGCGIRLYLGCEYHVNGQICESLKSGRCHALAGGRYVLCEYEYETEYSYISEQSRNLLMHGYIPVIAHVERYKCLNNKPQLCEEIKELGAVIQINADSVLGIEGHRSAALCRKLLKHGWADIIASDAHGMTIRTNHMGKCYSYVQRKYGQVYAQQLFSDNAKAILDMA